MGRDGLGEAYLEPRRMTFLQEDSFSYSSLGTSPGAEFMDVLHEKLAVCLHGLRVEDHVLTLISVDHGGVRIALEPKTLSGEVALRRFLGED